jgi:hypothetical protein
VYAVYTYLTLDTCCVYHLLLYISTHRMKSRYHTSSVCTQQQYLNVVHPPQSSNHCTHPALRKKFFRAPQPYPTIQIPYPPPPPNNSNYLGLQPLSRESSITLPSENAPCNLLSTTHLPLEALSCESKPQPYHTPHSFTPAPCNL